MKKKITIFQLDEQRKNAPLCKIMPLLFVLIIYSFNVKAQESEMKQIPLQISAEKGNQTTLMIYITGDGGLTDFSQSFVQELEKQGYGVVSLNSRKYFWSQRDPDDFANDIEKIAEYYLKAWGKTSLAIAGYSFGANVGAFLPSRLSPAILEKVKLFALLSPSSSTDFVIRISDLLKEKDTTDRKYKLEPELIHINFPVMIFFGKEEQLALKNSLRKNESIVIHELPGDHKYNNDYDLLLKLMGLKEQ